MTVTLDALLIAQARVLLAARTAPAAFPAAVLQLAQLVNQAADQPRPEEK